MGQQTCCVGLQQILIDNSTNNVKTAYRTTKINRNKISNNFNITITISIFCWSPTTNTPTNTSQCILKELSFRLFRNNVKNLRREGIIKSSYLLQSAPLDNSNSHAENASITSP
ncbi:pyruvate dehydrogenase E1 component subunit alpha [Striga asiatica]|uniref:Pyruvate dehydrogenase E1 component subunit alpha n=1 Tax=Striga asiatica TaxID=4170 RepID=A0A5A7RKD1_STRAF|nr:pyruvate dehydrogenase E1 component subunit alpha [Striga asiatica]